MSATHHGADGNGPARVVVHRDEVDEECGAADEGGDEEGKSTICLIHTLPPMRAYSEPPKYPLTGAVAAYTKMAVERSEPRSV